MRRLALTVAAISLAFGRTALAQEWGCVPTDDYGAPCISVIGQAQLSAHRKYTGLYVANSCDRAISARGYWANGGVPGGDTVPANRARYRLSYCETATCGGWSGRVDALCTKADKKSGAIKKTDDQPAAKVGDKMQPPPEGAPKQQGRIKPQQRKLSARITESRRECGRNVRTCMNEWQSNNGSIPRNIATPERKQNVLDSCYRYNFAVEQFCAEFKNKAPSAVLEAHAANMASKREAYLKIEEALWKLESDADSRAFEAAVEAERRRREREVSLPSRRTEPSQNQLPSPAEQPCAASTEVCKAIRGW